MNFSSSNSALGRPGAKVQIFEHRRCDGQSLVPRRARSMPFEGFCKMELIDIR